MSVLVAGNIANGGKSAFPWKSPAAVKAAKGAGRGVAGVAYAVYCRAAWLFPSGGGQPVPSWHGSVAKCTRDEMRENGFVSRSNLLLYAAAITSTCSETEWLNIVFWM